MLRLSVRASCGRCFFKSGIYKNALVIGAESLSKIVDWTDRGTCVLFGDGAGAAFLTASEEGGILSQSVGSNGEKWEVLSCPKGGYLQMNGQEVFKFAVRTGSTVRGRCPGKSGYEGR